MGPSIDVPEHGMLRPISFEALDTTLPVLSRGFPGMRQGGWTSAIARLRAFGASDMQARAGYLFEDKGRNVGVILTIPSTRADDTDAPRRVENLSSWYIDPEHRWRAPRMLQTVSACNATLFTDLTATPSVRSMISRIGFRGWTEGTLVFALPWFAMKTAGPSHVVPLRDLPPDAFAGSTRRMLDRHAALDCISGGLWDGAALHPLIFSRKIYRGIRAARLIFADSRAAMFAHLPAISRFLLREKFLLLAVNADHSERVAGSLFTRRTSPAFYKGPAAPAPCDLAFSEFVFLQI
jgi:hypothetical protein